VGSGNRVVGNKMPADRSDQPIDDGVSNDRRSVDESIVQPRKPGRNGLCGAMSLQGGDFRGNVSLPQKFVRLVGCREPSAVREARILAQTELIKR